MWECLVSEWQQGSVMASPSLEELECWVWESRQESKTALELSWAR
jgi:hypothetical protein